ncbi:MAG TPA: hypothetical protein VEP67_12125 [Thiobacillaceae bacterium]|nr:hypothetical protein [Thiobacillaceae bacterium]
MRLFTLLFLGLLLSGCALAVSDPRALVPFEGFVPLAEDDRVWVEPGYEDYGTRVANLLPSAMARVERGHGRPFRFAPRVYVCGTEACFKRYVLTPRLSAAVVPDNRLILSPNLDGRESDRLEPLLVHELAHLHLGQEIGHYDSSVPIWFHEGWASLTADGGGAEFATDEQAYKAAGEGRAIDLAARDTPDLRHKANSFNVNIYEFYRQAMLLVGKLKGMNEAKFAAFTQAIQDNEDFEIAFWDIYGAGPETILGTAWARNDAKQDRDSGAAAPAEP